MSRFHKFVDEKCSYHKNDKKKKKKMDESTLNEASYKSAFTEDKALWKLVRKHWPKEAKQLEKGYDEKIMNALKDSVMGSISRYGLK